MKAPEAVLSKVFGVDRSLIDDTTSNRSLPEWDSLGHTILVVELEATYGLSLSAEDALVMTDVGSIKRILQDRGVRW